MGGVGDFLFGKESEQESTSSSSSGNLAWPQIQSAFSPALGYFTQGGNMLGSMLGLNNSVPAPGPAPTPTPSPSPTPTPGGGGGGDYDGFMGFRERLREKQGLDNTEGPTVLPPTATTPTAPTYSPEAQNDALTNFSNSTGMDFIRSQGVKALEGSQAGKGMLQSGATGTKLVEFGQGLGKTFLNQYLDRLLDYSKLGLSAGGLMTGAGSWSTSSGSGSGSGGKEGFYPKMAAAAAQSAAMSDARLKEDITVIGEYEDGLPKVEFRYRGSPIRYVGVIAQDVARLRPEALGPTVNGFLTVADKALFPRRITNG